MLPLEVSVFTSNPLVSDRPDDRTGNRTDKMDTTKIQKILDEDLRPKCREFHAFGKNFPRFIRSPNPACPPWEPLSSVTFAREFSLVTQKDYRNPNLDASRVSCGRVSSFVQSPVPRKVPENIKKNHKVDWVPYRVIFLEIDSDTDPILAQTMLVSLPPSPNLLHLKNKRTAYFVPTFFRRWAGVWRRALDVTDQCGLIF